jgi:hypothetical protein
MQKHSWAEGIWAILDTRPDVSIAIPRRFWLCESNRLLMERLTIEFVPRRNWPAAEPAISEREGASYNGAAL